MRRIAAAVAIVFAVVTIVFILIHLAPGEPFLGQDQIQDPEVRRRLIAQFGLDQPLYVQYWKFLAQLSHGDLGYSFSLFRPVRDALVETIPFTLQLAGVALFL